MTSEQFMRLARLMPEPMLLVSDEGRILAANPPALEAGYIMHVPKLIEPEALASVVASVAIGRKGD